jgi:hypothetical protein
MILVKGLIAQSHTWFPWTPSGFHLAPLPATPLLSIFTYPLYSSSWSGSPVDTAEKEGRKALNRLRRAMEKGVRELEALEGAIRHAEGEDFPAEAYGIIRNRIDAILEFLEEEGQRLEAKVLERGGLEPGRIRRSSE